MSLRANSSKTADLERLVLYRATDCYSAEQKTTSGSEADDLGPHFDCHHHAFVFVFDDMAVKHEAPENFRICERNDELGLARFPILGRRNAKGVAKAIEICWRVIYLCHQKSGLMNVKVVVLRIVVDNRPFLGVAELHSYVGPVLIKDLVIYEECCLLLVDRKCERAPIRNRT